MVIIIFKCLVNITVIIMKLYVNCDIKRPDI